MVGVTAPDTKGADIDYCGLGVAVWLGSGDVSAWPSPLLARRSARFARCCSAALFLSEAIGVDEATGRDVATFEADRVAVAGGSWAAAVGEISGRLGFLPRRSCIFCWRSAWICACSCSRRFCFSSCAARGVPAFLVSLLGRKDVFRRTGLCRFRCCKRCYGGLQSAWPRRDSRSGIWPQGRGRRRQCGRRLGRIAGQRRRRPNRNRARGRNRRIHGLTHFYWDGSRRNGGFLFRPNKSFRREICGRGGFRLHLGTSFLCRRLIPDPCPAAFGYRLCYRPNDAVRTRRALRRAKIHRWQRDHVAAEDRSVRY